VRGPSRTSRPAPATLEGGEVEVRILDEPEDRLRVLEQHLARLGQADRPASLRALDQPVADALLEDRDLLADRRLREAEARGGAAERALTRDRPQRGEVTELDAGPATEPTRGVRSALRSGAQVFGCFPPAEGWTMIVEPAMARG
jgi:hypothetical protein